MGMADEGCNLTAWFDLDYSTIKARQARQTTGTPTRCASPADFSETANADAMVLSLDKAVGLLSGSKSVVINHLHRAFQ